MFEYHTADLTSHVLLRLPGICSDDITIISPATDHCIPKRKKNSSRKLSAAECLKAKRFFSAEFLVI